MIRVFALIVATCSACLQTAEADTWDPEEFYTAISAVNTSDEIEELVRRELHEADANLIWQEALELSASDEQAVQTTAPVASWAETALARQDPTPSGAPFLKVLWIGWFAEAFQGLGHPEFRASNYQYIAFDVVPLTAPSTIDGWSEHPALSAHQRRMLKLFVDLRAFLERRY